MNDLVAFGVLPWAAGIFGLVLGGPIGGFLGLFLGLVVGLLALYTDGSNEERIEELEQEVQELQRELDDEQ